MGLSECDAYWPDAADCELRAQLRRYAARPFLRQRHGTQGGRGRRLRQHHRLGYRPGDGGPCSGIDDAMTMAAAAAWQRGYALEELQRLAAPFKASNKPHVYGAFGLTKERDVAAALAEQRCSWVSEGGAVAVVALSRLFKVGSRSHDFRGEVIQIPAGDHVVSDLGWRAQLHDVPGALARLLDGLWQRSGARAQWVEYFAEDAALAAAMASLNFALCAVKIMAGSEIKHLACRARSAAELRDRQERCCPAILPWDARTLDILQPAAISAQEHAAMLGELRAFGASAWMQHYSVYNKRDSWTAFA